MYFLPFFYCRTSAATPCLAEKKLVNLSPLSGTYTSKHRWRCSSNTTKWFWIKYQPARLISLLAMKIWPIKQLLSWQMSSSLCLILKLWKEQFWKKESMTSQAKDLLNKQFTPLNQHRHWIKASTCTRKNNYRSSRLNLKTLCTTLGMLI